MQTNFRKGISFALSAAALNATISVLSKVLMNHGYIASSVAVIKTILGFILLSSLLPFLKKSTSNATWTQAAICAFLGIFVLFHFETLAYHHYSSAGVVVVLMASASISSIFLARIFLKDAITLHVMLGATLTILGIAIIFGNDLQSGFTFQGAILAAVAGSGYGAFSVVIKRMKISGGLHVTRQLLFFGALYLLMPAASDEFVIGVLSPLTVGALLSLATLPTIFGFYCTTKAIEYLRPSQVQATELTEPLFAALFAFLLLKELPQDGIFLGAPLIILGLCFANGIIRLSRKKPLTSVI